MRLFIITMIMVMGSFCAKATTYYVSATGNDVNTGIAKTNSWASIAKVNATIFFPGDSILFEGGAIFTGSIYFGPSVIGTPQQPIVIGSYGNGRATISSGIEAGIYVENSAGFKLQDLIFQGAGRETNITSGVDFYMNLTNTKLHYIAIDNVEIYGYREVGISIGSWNGTSGFQDIAITNCSSYDNGDAGIGIYASTGKLGHKNVYIANTKVYNNSGIAGKATNTGNGIVLGGVDGGLIEHCEAYNNGWLNSSSQEGPVGIWCYVSNNIVMQYNESHHNRTGSSKDGGGFDIDGGSTNCIIQYNYSHDNDGAGYLLTQYSKAPVMKNNVIRYNISVNDGRKNGYGAIHLWSSGSNGGIQDTYVYNNTIYLTSASHGTPKAVWVQSGGTTEATFRNNLFVTTGTARLVDVQATANIRFEGNNYWASGATPYFRWGSTNYSALSSWRNATGQELLAGTAVGYYLDPELKLPEQSVTLSDPYKLYTLQSYKLQKNSAMVGKALDLSKDFGIATGERDFWGNSITQRNDLCIGAHQLTTERKVCLQGGVLPLTFGQIEGGVYSGKGVVEGEVFDPSAAGAGSHALKYTFTDAEGFPQVLHKTASVVDGTATSWTGNGGNSSWFDSENWSTCIPTSKVDVIIPPASNGQGTLPVIYSDEYAYAHNLTAEGVLTIEQDGSLEIGNSILSTNLSTSPLSSIIFQSDETQHIPGGNFGQLVLQGTGMKKLSGQVVVTNLLELNETKLALGSYDLTIASTGSIQNFGPTSYIVTDGAGQLILEQVGSGIVKTFPVGTAESYAPVKLQNKGIADNFSIRVEEGLSSFTPDQGFIKESAVNKTWQISEAVPGGSDVTMNLQWNTTDELPDFNRESSYVSHYENGQWKLVENSLGTLAKGTDPNTYSINVTGVTSFSPFGVVGPEDTPIPLPITLLTFKASQQNLEILLEWSTASELDNAGFEIEVSLDGKQFRTIGYISSKVVNSQIVQYYRFRDSTVQEAGVRYYRLRQVDLDGTSTYSPTRAVLFNRPVFELSMYPNPFSDVVTLELEALHDQNVVFTVTDMKGKTILKESIHLQKGFSKQTLNIGRLAHSSVYFVSVNLNNRTYQHKLFKR